MAVKLFSWIADDSGDIEKHEIDTLESLWEFVNQQQKSNNPDRTALQISAEEDEFANPYLVVSSQEAS